MQHIISTNGAIGVGDGAVILFNYVPTVQSTTEYSSSTMQTFNDAKDRHHNSSPTKHISINVVQVHVMVSSRFHVQVTYFAHCVLVNFAGLTL